MHLQHNQNFTIRPGWIRGIEEVLLLVFKRLLYSEKAIKAAFASHRKWGSHDRSFIAENVYDIVRWNKRIRWALGLNTDDMFQHQAEQYIPLMVAAYLSLKYDVDLLNHFGHKRETFFSRWEQAPIGPIVHSVSDWLWNYGLQQLPERWEIELQNMNCQADVFLRVNTLKTNRQNVIEILRSEGIETVEVDGASDALKLVRRANVSHLQSFRKGLFDIQDAASQQVAHFCDLTDGMLVLDACAGAGGKTTHMATLMHNTGKVVATDIEPLRLKEIPYRSKRLGLTNIEVFYHNKKPQHHWYGLFDRVLLDVPCSGSGTIRRNPDAKWRITRSLIDDVLSKQLQILETNAPMVKYGGKLIYATCSIFPSENQQQIETFLQRHPEFELEECVTLYPSEYGWDGFFIARLVRT